MSVLAYLRYGIPVSMRGLDKAVGDELTAEEKRAVVDIYKDCWPYQGSSRFGFDATILPAIARGFLAGKKRRQPD